MNFYRKRLADYFCLEDKLHTRTTTMSAADQLVKQIFYWIEKRQECANKLKKLAQELESLRENCNVSKAVGSTVTVVGAAFLIGAGVATLFTGGAAAPLLGLTGVCVGVGISLTTKLIEHLKESDTMKDAKKAESKGHEITKTIQGLFEKLKEECKKANPSADPDDQDQHAMTEIVGAMAKRSGLNPRSIKPTFQQHFSHGGQGALDVDTISLQPTLVKLAGVLTFFDLEASGERSKILFAEGAEQMLREVAKTGVMAVLKKIFQAVGKAIIMAFDLPEAIDHWTNLIEGNNVTEASQSLRDAADALRKLNHTLRAQLDEIKKMLEKLDQLKRYIENSNRSSEDKKNFMEIVEKCCHDKGILNCLKKTDDAEKFFKLVDIFHLLKQELDKQENKTDRWNIDIIFVAHGAIEERLIPARTLLPLSTIDDVILYSPWNCTIDANVAYGIATGRLQTQDRNFCCRQKCGCSNHDRHQPRSLPPNWNSMRDAGGSKIPNILVSPLNHPEDCAWNKVLLLSDKHGEPGRNRVVIPYIIPGYDGDGSMTIPFCVVTLALSLVLFINPFTARVHLAACLSRSSRRTLTEQFKTLEQQYSCTIGDTHMTAKEEALKPLYPGLFRALKAMFNL